MVWFWHHNTGKRKKLWDTLTIRPNHVSRCALQWENHWSGGLQNPFLVLFLQCKRQKLKRNPRC